jgi:F-type H+-transporting ATPase subunit delta
LITTARKLDDQERREIESQAAEIAGSQIRATFQEDSTLVGGVVLRIGSTVYDGSVRGRLQRLKEQLIAG